MWLNFDKWLLTTNNIVIFELACQFRSAQNIRIIDRLFSLLTRLSVIGLGQVQNWRTSTD